MRRKTITDQQYLYPLLNSRYYLQKIIYYLKNGRAPTRNILTEHTPQGPPERTQGSITAYYRNIVDTKP